MPPLRQYQLDGAAFLQRNSAALLADEMGLGKTVQAAVALRNLCESYVCRRILIVVPASLRLNWREELTKWAPQIVTRPVLGDQEDRVATYRLPIQVLIATYEQIRLDLPALRHLNPFDLIVLDEAQRIKNPDSSLTLACRLIPRIRSWALTGTPLENRPNDFISIFNFLEQGLLSFGMSRREIQDKAQPHFLRRTKRAVLKELPPIIDSVLHLYLTDEQRFAYDDLWSSRYEYLKTGGRSGRPIDMLALITALKQICNRDPQTGASSKLEALKGIIEECIENEQNVLVFSQYVSTLHWLSGEFAHCKNEVFHGSLNEQERSELVAEFENSPRSRLLFVSLKAGGTGLNLKTADTVVLFDRWWNPAVENQAVNRAHRFGREIPLQVIRFLVANSIEENIQKILIEKKRIFDDYVSDLEAPAERSIESEDLKTILKMATPN